MGTSYHFNLAALYDVRYGPTEDTNPWNPPGTWADISRALIRDVRRSHSSTFTMFFEDPMDWALHDGEAATNLFQVMGSHGEFSKHSCGYLDGHADYLYRDTRTFGGVGWAAINPDWVLHFGQPHPRPIRYGSYGKNCHPPHGW